MCLIAFSYKQHPDYDFIFVANRDEEYDRPTRSAQFWDSHSNILAGKDLKAGGTWMGITKKGAFAALTNYRNPDIKKENPPSRGHLVLDYLKKDDDPANYLKKLDKKADQYKGFSILASTIDKLAYYTNWQKEIQLLDRGLYGLSNHLLDTPWPKVKRAKMGLKQIIQEDTFSEKDLFELLADDKEAPEDQLPETGIPREIEKKVSPIFIKSDKYGTRCSTILLISTNGQVTFSERRFKAGTQDIMDENRYQFTIRNREYTTSDS
jgi:uncharacterized protein with NRDE domain